MNRYFKDFKIPSLCCSHKNHIEIEKWIAYKKTKDYRLNEKIRSVRCGDSPSWNIKNTKYSVRTKYPESKTQINFPILAFGVKPTITLDYSLDMRLRIMVIENEEERSILYYQIGD